MKKKVLLLGSTGLIGHQIYNYLKQFSDLEIINVVFRKKLTDESIILDLRNEQKLDSLIIELKPDYIINCVGILISGSNLDPENAIFLNSFMPHHLMKIADRINAKLIHISTDCVFSGKKGQYIESDEKDGYSLYSKSKALGEINNSRHLTIRTSVVGPELKTNGEELFHWFMQQNKVINGYTKSIWSGVTTLELAKAVKRVIDQNTVGLYHITNNNSINKFELLNLFKKYTGKNIEINPVDGVISDKSFIDTRQEFSYQFPDYNTMVKELIDFIKKNETLYSHYKIN